MRDDAEDMNARWVFLILVIAQRLIWAGRICHSETVRITVPACGPPVDG
jgi:hypothetical protein